MFLDNSKQVVLLYGQTSFPLKSILANLKVGDKLPRNSVIIIGYMDNKIKRLCIRLSPEEEKLFKEKASRYHNVSAMVRDAVRQFNDIATLGRIDALNEMVDLYKKYQQDLSWLGGNFNQAMKRANELTKSGLLNRQYYEQCIIPQGERILDFLEDIKREQQKIAKKLIKI